MPLMPACDWRAAALHVPRYSLLLPDNFPFVRTFTVLPGAIVAGSFVNNCDSKADTVLDPGPQAIEFESSLRQP